MRKPLLSENVKKTDRLKYLRGEGTLTSKWIWTVHGVWNRFVPIMTGKRSGLLWIQ